MASIPAQRKVQLLACWRVAARLSGAVVLYREDLQHGALVGGVTIMNPFLAG